MSFSRKDYLIMLGILILWAGNVVAIKMAVTEVAPLTAATLRFLLGGLIFLPFAKKTDRQSLWTIFQISMSMNVVHIGLLFIGLQKLDAASASILLQSQVVFATLLGCFFFKEKIRWRTWTGIALAVAGIAVMMGEPDIGSHPDAVAIMLVSTFFLAYSYVKMKHLKSVHPATYISMLCLCAVPFVFTGSLVISPESWKALPEANWLLLGPVFAYQAILVSLTHIVWQRMMHKGDVGKVTAFTLLIPFFTVVLSVLLLGEHIDWPMIVGGLITMVGVGIITLRRIQKGIA